MAICLILTMPYSLFINIKKFFRLEKETKAFKDRILRDVKNLFER